MLLHIRRANETINAVGCFALQHHQFFQASPLKIFLLLGALLLTAAPVQAFETFEELDFACVAKGERKMCGGAATYASGVTAGSLLCTLVSQGLVTPVKAAEFWQEAYKEMKNPLWIQGAKTIVLSFPDCPINP